MAVYKDISQVLEQDIRNNLSCGDYLPSEAELAKRFSINRHTLRRAVDQLVDAGMLLRQQGKGTLVVENTIAYNIGPRARFSESLQALGHSTCCDVIGRRVLVADERFSRASGMAAGTPILQVDTLRSMNGQPANLICHYLKREASPGLELHYRGGSLHAYIEEHHGVRLVRQQALIGTTLPTRHEAELLQYPRHMPVLVVKSNNVRSGTDEVLEYSISRSRADCFEYRIRPQMTDSPTEENSL
jgi:GntR family phosphonate transport system transcriptional regulator